MDYLPGDAISTHAILVRAAAEAFRALGAISVVVAEGPGHQRDTQLILCKCGYKAFLRNDRIGFTDLNRDELIRTPLRARYTGMKELWLPRTVLEADFIVSMPKVKAHHWSGVTLSMKNVMHIFVFTMIAGYVDGPLDHLGMVGNIAIVILRIAAAIGVAALSWHWFEQSILGMKRYFR